MNTDYQYLYVEDDPYSREIMEIIMRDMLGINSLIIFENSDNFVQRVQALERVPDIFLLDIHITPHSGFELLQMIRNELNLEDAVVVALTASVMNEEVNQLKAVGFNGAIAKPIDVSTFPDLLKKLEAHQTVWHIG